MGCGLGCGLSCQGAESWQMGSEQKVQHAEKIKTQGNELFKRGRLYQAAERYRFAPVYLAT